MRWLFGRSTDRAREAELSSFRAELEAAAQRDLQNGLLGLLAQRADELRLTEDDGALELEMLDGLQQLAGLVQLVERDGLPLVETQHRVIAGEPCRFSASATRLGEAGGGDGTSGRLFLTDRRTVFLGPSVTSAPWPSIAHVGRAGRDLLLSGASSRLEFRLNTFADAMRAAWLSERLR